MPDFEMSKSDQVNRIDSHVILRRGASEIVFAHMRQSSVSVMPNDLVNVADVLGRSPIPVHRPSRICTSTLSAPHLMVRR
ncbi:hypothetical protein ACSSV4_003283 [Roseovarius sp. MBR-154]|jgi:hypothetical protein